MNNKRPAGIIIACIMIIVVLMLVNISCVPTTTYTLSVSVSPSGAGSVSPSGGKYESGEQVKLTAKPATCYTFGYWTGDWTGDALGTTSTITITMDSDKSVTAHFEPDVLFFDDFSDESSGWGTWDTYLSKAMYQDGYYYMMDYIDEVTMISPIPYHFTDFVLEVETWLLGGTDNNWHMVLCRYQDTNNYYSFAISADGYYHVYKEVDDNRTFFVEPTHSPYINQGVDEENLIHIACIGSSLSLSVNGHPLWEGTDASHTGGYIALGAHALAGTSAKGGDTKVAFDNIVVCGIG